MLKEPVFSMELQELPGTRPKPQRKERNVNADKFIQTYLNNEKQKTIPQDLQMRNPLFSDFNYHSKRDYNSYLQNAIPSYHSSKSQNPSRMKNHVEDSIDQLQKSSSIQQLQNKLDNFQQSEQQKDAKSTISSQHQSRKSQDHDTKSRKSDASQYYQKLQKNMNEYNQIVNPSTQRDDYQNKLYIRNNVLGGANEYYKPQFNIDVKFSLYDRPKFKDYTYSDVSYKKVVELKNRYQVDEMMNNDFVTTGKDYGYGLKGYTKVPIYPSSKPQNIDRE